MGLIFTEEQQEVINYLLTQVNGPNGKNVVVSGVSGAGKTAVICEVIYQLLVQGKTVTAMAMTGQATDVLRGRVYAVLEENDFVPADDQLQIETVAKITKISKPIGAKTGSGRVEFLNKWRDPRVFKRDVLIIDELSMVPSVVGAWWRMTNSIVFGFGDERQLPEVTSGSALQEIKDFCHDLKIPSIDYVSGYGVKALSVLASKKLTKVLRADNEIALLGNELRDFSMTKTGIINTIKKWALNSDTISYSENFQDIETDPSWQIICFTNKLCREINNQLCIGKDYPAMDDKILLFDNLNPVHMYNGNTMKFSEFLTRIATHNSESFKRGTTKNRLYICVQWQGKMPSRQSPNPIEREYAQMRMVYEREVKILNKQRLDELPKVIENSGFSNKAALREIVDEVCETTPNAGDAYIEIINRIQLEDRNISQYLFSKAPRLPQFHYVKLDYGYAITTHKSQGSEYDKVCYVLERFDKPLLYTGITRAKKQLKVVNLTKY